jgi:hypothetical protein
MTQLEFPIITERVNYLVNSFVKDPIPCETVKEVWEAVGTLPFGAPYWVSSPTGKNTHEFIPF